MTAGRALLEFAAIHFAMPPASVTFLYAPNTFAPVIFALLLSLCICDRSFCLPHFAFATIPSASLTPYLKPSLLLPPNICGCSFHYDLHFATS